MGIDKLLMVVDAMNKGLIKNPNKLFNLALKDDIESQKQWKSFKKLPHIKSKKTVTMNDFLKYRKEKENANRKTENRSKNL